MDNVHCKRDSVHHSSALIYECEFKYSGERIDGISCVKKVDMDIININVEAFHMNSFYLEIVYEYTDGSYYRQLYSVDKLAEERKCWEKFGGFKGMALYPNPENDDTYILFSPY